MTDDFTREEAQVLESRALNQADLACNPDWVRAYSDLAYALNVLDAHMARSTED
jgi:hypothetical protein